MSFNDLERGSVSRGSVRGSPNGGGSGGGAGSGGGRLPLYHAPPSAPEQEDPEFRRLADRLGIQIFKINANVAGIEKLVGLNGAKDKDWTKQVHDLTETTRSLIKDSTGDVKALAAQTAQGSSSRATPGARQRERLAASKLQRDFEVALHAFQRAQRRGAERSRDALEGERQTGRQMKSEVEDRKRESASSTSEAALIEVEEGARQAESSEGGAGSEQLQEQAQEQAPAGPSQAELEFQEALIAEREAEIREIEGGIHELNEIFRDLGHIVQEQGGMIDNIEFNVTSVATNTGAADRELVSAHDYQRKAGRRAACLMLVVGVVIAIVLLALLS